MGQGHKPFPVPFTVYKTAFSSIHSLLTVTEAARLHHKIDVLENIVTNVWVGVCVSLLPPPHSTPLYSPSSLSCSRHFSLQELKSIRCSSYNILQNAFVDVHQPFTATNMTAGSTLLYLSCSTLLQLPSVWCLSKNGTSESCAMRARTAEQNSTQDPGGKIYDGYSKTMCTFFL